MILFTLDTALLLMVAFVAYVFISPARRWIFLLLLSLGILASLGLFGLGLMVAQVSAAYLMGLWLAKGPSRGRLAICVLAQLCPMLFYKLSGFSAWRGFAEIWGMPLGLSFYTFQMISYLVEVYWGRMAVRHHFGQFLLYGVLLFNKVAGPIERPTLMNQMPIIFLPPPEKLYRSAILIWFGYFQKGVLADNLHTLVDPVLKNANEYAGLPVFCAMLLSKYQIFCDFSGASLLALGTAGLFGLDLTLNFDRPFAARSLREFWTRWHISLQTWIRDYVFYPLLSTRLALYGTLPPLLISFLVFGLWHDIRWTFAVYGLLQGFLVWARPERAYAALFRSRWTLPLALGLNYVLWISVPGILFRAHTLAEAWAVWSSVGVGLSNWSFFVNVGALQIHVLLALIALNEVLQWIVMRTDWLERFARKAWYWRVVPVPAMILILILYYHRGELRPFIYSIF